MSETLARRSPAPNVTRHPGRRPSGRPGMRSEASSCGQDVQPFGQLVELPVTRDLCGPAPCGPLVTQRRHRKGADGRTVCRAGREAPTLPVDCHDGQVGSTAVFCPFIGWPCACRLLESPLHGQLGSSAVAQPIGHFYLNSPELEVGTSARLRIMNHVLLLRRPSHDRPRPELPNR